MINNWHHETNSIIMLYLLQVKTPFVQSKLISFVPLPSPNDTIKTNDLAIVSGWGRLSVNKIYLLKLFYNEIIKYHCFISILFLFL